MTLNTIALVITCILYTVMFASKDKIIYTHYVITHAGCRLHRGFVDCAKETKVVSLKQPQTFCRTQADSGPTGFQFCSIAL